MKQFPQETETMTKNSNCNPHTVREDPIWVGRHQTFWFVLFVSAFVSVGFANTLIHSLGVPMRAGVLFFVSVPIVFALLIEHFFVQQFFIPEWERSKSMTSVRIRSLSFAQIREWIEWNMRFRDKSMKYIASGNAFIFVIDALFIHSFDNMWITLLIPIELIAATLIRAHFSFKQFKFTSAHFAEAKTYTSVHDE